MAGRDDELEVLRAELARVKAQNEELRREKRISLALFEHAPVAIEVYDEQGTALWLNQAQVAFLGLPSAAIAVGQFNCLTDPSTKAQGFTPFYERAYAGETVALPDMQIDLEAYDSRWQTPAREPWFEGLLMPLRNAEGEVEGVASFVHEITKAKQAEAALLTAQRHESLGLLAGGIAHDFNNLLTAIMGNASIAQFDDLSREEIDAHLDQIVKASEHAALLTRQLLAYAGKGELRHADVELGGLARDVIHVLRALVSGKINVRVISEGEHWVEADEVQMQQVLMNLITNAAQAIGEDQVGSISLVFSTIEASPDYLEQAFVADELRPGRYVCVEVSDTGCGMDAETQAQLFEPFFTTKPDGHGLGMAAILGIVRSHRGAIRVYSSPGQGTTIKLLFPERPSEEAEAEAEAAEALSIARKLRVLIADDEEFIRLFAKRVLERDGHEVVVVDDGGAAVEAFAAAPFDLVLLDMSMPVMNGAEVFRELRRRAPDLPILLTSGYNEQDTLARFAGKGLAGFLQKPYRALDLQAAIEGLF